NPASNVKLFTTAAALAILGPEYRWKTVVYADAPVAAGELKGRLYLKGHGDPSLVVEDLWRVVTDLYAGGLRKVTGDLVVDDTFFDAAPARVMIDPQTPYFTVVNDARTVAAGRTTITVESRETSDHTELKVAGRIRASDGEQVVLRRVAHPDLYTANAFRELLLRRGIKVSGNIVRDATPTTAKALSA